MARLRVIDGPLVGHEFTLGSGSLVAGRLRECGISLPDPKASRNHAEFSLDKDGKYCLTDLGSANGTFLNDLQLPPKELRRLTPGDAIRIGSNTFHFLSSNASLPDIKIPGFILDDVLAEGGMGTIYRARQVDTNQVVAVKILHPGHALQEEFVDRFIQEARTTGRLSHPNIIKVYNVGKTNDRYYFTMELVKGTSLTQRMASLPLELTMMIFMEVADALDYAHKHGIIHRDIKPDNILIGEDGEPKVTDLGIAILDSREAREGGAQKVLGTPHYMSPEQAAGKAITPATDIYSLGATFYHVISGAPLFDAHSPEGIMVKQVRELPRPLLTVVPDLQPDIAQIIDRCLEKDPKNRFASAAELRDAVKRILDHFYPGMFPTINSPTRWPTPRLWKIAALVLFLLVVFVLLLNLLT
ncbi:MAG: protein kinase [Planctomycetota bacterium]|jgi:serine/threonine protein kinase|nr:protein kinase [Planctomycetota bacterium]